MRFETITVTPCTPKIGAEIGEVDLTKPISSRQAQEIRQAFADYQVVFFRDQKIDHDAHVRIARIFGEPYKFVGEIANSEATDNPYIRRQHFDAGSKRVSGELWHTDQTCVAVPPLGSVLYNHTVPEDGGGDTLFASMYCAYDALSPAMQEFLEGLTAVHDGKNIFGPNTPASVHPVVVKHPVTGKKMLFVNRGFVKRIRELSGGESAVLLEFLCEHQIHPNWEMRFRWTPHSIAVWDNLCTQHRAIWDYWPDTRSGFRIQFTGDKPLIPARPGLAL